jgi:PAS domain S-box-containing protein
LPSIPDRPGRVATILASAGLFVIAGFWYTKTRTPAIPRGILRIGFENVPSVQIRTDRGFSGLAVEAISEAAKRAGLSLQWVETGTSSEEALRRGLVDLWPLMIDLPERRKYVHITEPWLHANHTLILPQASAIPDRNFTGGIAFLHLPIHARLVREEFPQARLVQLPDSRDVVRAVCMGTVSAGFMEDRAALDALREKPAECGATGFRVVTIPHLRLPLGVGSSFAAAGAADRIRDEIGGLFRDGTLAALMAKYSYYGLDDTWAAFQLMQASEWARWLGWITGALAVGLTLIFGQTYALRQRKLSEAALRESEERFRALFSQAAVGVAQLSLEGRVEFANDCYCRIMGYTQEDLQGKGTVEFTHGKHLLSQLPMLHQLLAGKIQSYSMEKRYERSDGTVIWAKICKSLARNGNRRPKHIIAIVEDITERKHAEEALRENEQCLVSIYNTVGDPLFRVAVEPEGEFRFVSVNAAFLKVTGLSLDQVVGKTVGDVIPEPSLTIVLGKYRQAVKENTIVQWIETSDYPTGRLTGEVRVAPVRDDRGHCTHLVGSVHDITEHRRAEAAIRESEERFRNMADTAPVLIWVSGRDNLLTFFNRGWLTFTGSTLEQAIGNGWIEKVHPDDRDRCYTAYASAFDAHRTFQTECRLRRADGEYRWMLTIGSPRFESCGDFAGFIGSCTDITDFKRSHEESLARQKLESLGVLAGGVAHDFNNLLGSVIANSELVLSELPDGSPAAYGVESIKTVAGRAAEIVRQMMSYAGHGDTVFEPVDLSALLHEMVEFLKVSISKRATLKITLPQELPAVRANAAQLRQVILNLITNASEGLGEQEGVISITAARLQSGPSDSAPNLCRGDYVRLEVSDTGCGMTEETQSKIFDPFFSTKFAGRGMGLAVVKGVVHSHDGAINVVSAPGRGSRFEILLPCSSEPAKEGHDKAGFSAAGEVVSSSGAVLIVEDEHTLRAAVSRMLRRKGFTVFEAADGDAGASLFRDKAPQIDVVLLDLTLPGLSGGELLRELRRLQPDVTVIVTSAYSREQAQTTLGAQPPSLYIRKPYQVKELTDMLRESIRDKRQVSNPANGREPREWSATT